MLSKYIPNFLLLSTNELIIFVISLVFTTAAGVTAFLQVSSKTLSRLKCVFYDSSIASDSTEIIYSKELETHLGALERKLIQKAGELKASAKTESLEKLADTQAKVKRYYVHLKQEIKNSEDDFAKIQSKIDGYMKQRVEIEQHMKLNEKYYNNLLRAVPKAPSADVLINRSSQVGSLKDAACKQSASKLLTDEANGIYAKCSNPSVRNANGENTKTVLTSNAGTSGPHPTPIFDSVKKLKHLFSGPINLCWCGAIACSRNCVASKDLKVGRHPQQLLQNIVASEKLGKIINKSRGSTTLRAENKD